MLPLCRSEGIGVIPWSPLARGRLARPWSEEPTDAARRDGRVRRARSTSAPRDADRAVIERVGEIAAARGLPAAQVALAWLLQKPGITAPIVGATKPEHLKDAVAAVVGQAVGRGDQGAGSALRAASGGGIFLRLAGRGASAAGAEGVTCAETSAAVDAIRLKRIPVSGTRPKSARRQPARPGRE